MADFNVTFEEDNKYNVTYSSDGEEFSANYTNNESFNVNYSDTPLNIEFSEQGSQGPRGHQGTTYIKLFQYFTTGTTPSVPTDVVWTPGTGRGTLSGANSAGWSLTVPTPRPAGTSLWEIEAYYDPAQHTNADTWVGPFQTGGEGPQGIAGVDGSRITRIEQVDSENITVHYFQPNSSDSDSDSFALPRGPQGNVGPQGPQGVAGPAGDSISRIEQVDSENITIHYADGAGDSDSDSFVLPRGPRGNVGPQGPAGPAGTGRGAVAGDGIIVTTVGDTDTISIDSDVVLRRDAVTLEYLEDTIGNPNTLITFTDYTVTNSILPAAGQVTLRTSGGGFATNISDARLIKINPNTTLQRTILSRMATGSKYRLLKSTGTVASGYYTLDSVNVNSGAYEFTQNSTSNRHFTTGSIANGDTIQVALKPATFDIITGDSIVFNTVVDGHIAGDTISPSKLSTNGDTAVAGDFVRIGTDGVSFIYEAVNLTTGDSDSDIASITNSISGNQLTTTLVTKGGRNIPAAAVTLPGGGGSAFDLDSDVTTRAASIADNDKFVIADVSETGAPNRYVEMGDIKHDILDTTDGVYERKIPNALVPLANAPSGALNIAARASQVSQDAIRSSSNINSTTPSWGFYDDVDFSNVPTSSETYTAGGPANWNGFFANTFRYLAINFGSAVAAATVEAILSGHVGTAPIYLTAYRNATNYAIWKLNAGGFAEGNLLYLGRQAPTFVEGLGTPGYVAGSITGPSIRWTLGISSSASIVDIITSPDSETRVLTNGPLGPEYAQVTREMLDDDLEEDIYHLDSEVSALQREVSRIITREADHYPPLENDSDARFYRHFDDLDVTANDAAFVMTFASADATAVAAINTRITGALGRTSEADWSFEIDFDFIDSNNVKQSRNLQIISASLTSVSGSVLTFNVGNSENSNFTQARIIFTDGDGDTVSGAAAEDFGQGQVKRAIFYSGAGVLDLTTDFQALGSGEGQRAAGSLNHSDQLFITDTDTDGNVRARYIGLGDGLTRDTTNNQIDVVSRPNFGLTTYTEGVGLSSAFINAASVLALSTRYQYNTNGVANGDFTLSSVIQDTDSERITAPSGWNNVRSVILRGDDRNTPARSLAGLASFFGQGSILEIRPLNSEFARINSYGVYAINSANFNYTFGSDNDYIVLNITPADDTSLAQRDSGSDDDYGQNIYTGLIADNGSPILTNGSQYEIVLHGRQRSITGANILPETIHGFALADDAIGPNKISSGANDGSPNDLLIRDGSNFRFGLIDSDNINNNTITNDKLAGTLASSIQQFVNGNSYREGDLVWLSSSNVTRNNQIYRCTNNVTNASDPPNENWQLMSETLAVLRQYVSGQNYFAGQQVVVEEHGQYFLWRAHSDITNAPNPFNRSQWDFIGGEVVQNNGVNLNGEFQILNLVGAMFATVNDSADTATINVDLFYVDSDDSDMIVRQVDAYGKPISDGITRVNNSISRVVVSLGSQTWTKVLNRANGRISSIDYHLGNVGGSATLNTRKARKTLQRNASNQVIGTPITS